MNAQPRRVEHQQTDKGSVPVYTTAVIEQPWASYSHEDHATWAALFERQQKVLVGRACDEFLDNRKRLGLTPDAIPKFDELNRVFKSSTGWELIGVEGLLPELTFSSIWPIGAFLSPGGSAEPIRSTTSASRICSTTCSAMPRCCSTRCLPTTCRRTVEVGSRPTPSAAKR